MKTIALILALLPAVALADADDDAVAIQVAIANVQPVSIQPGGAKLEVARKASPPVIDSKLAEIRAALSAGDAALEAQRLATSPTAAVRQAQRPFTWNAKLGKWVSADGFCAEPGSTNWEPLAPAKRYVTIPAKGHWETFRVCDGDRCRNVRRWVQDAPARRVEATGTSLQTPVKRQPVKWPSYPSRPLGRRWTFNGGQITARHLAGGHHAHERFDPNWLNGLSNAQLTALGSDSHNHQDHLREQYIVRHR